MKLLIALRLNLVLSVYNRICHYSFISIYVCHVHKSYFIYRSVDNYWFPLERSTPIYVIRNEM